MRRKNLWIGCALAACAAMGIQARADQMVFLDFTGGTKAPEASEAGTDNKKNFNTSPVVARYIDATNAALDTKEEVADMMMDDILAKMKDQYKGFWVGFTKTKPGSGAFSTVDFGANTADKVDPTLTLGQVDTGPGSQIDPGNKNKSDNAWIFADAHDRAGRTKQQAVNELATSGSHELGHLLGLNHTDGDGVAGSIMDGLFDGTMHTFTNKSKMNLAKTVNLDVNGKHVKVQELIDAINGAITEASKLFSFYDPGAGTNGRLSFSGDQGTAIPFSTGVTGGTVRNQEGFHGEAFEIVDPFGDFVIALPSSMDVIGFDINGNPILQDATVSILMNPGDVQTELLQLQLTGVHFDPAATIVNFPGTLGSDVVVDDTTDEAVAGLIELLPGFIGDVQININPAFLGQGSYLDELAALLELGLTGEFFLSTTLGDTTNGFTTASSSDDNRAGFRLIPEPASLALIAVGLPCVLRRRAA